MKGNIYCPRCVEEGRKPKILGKYEDLMGVGEIYLWCKNCRQEIRISIKDIGINR